MSTYNTYGDVQTTYVTYNGVNSGVPTYTALLAETTSATALFAAGSFAFPTTTGTKAITGLGFRPQLVVMFGGNQASEDTLLTGLTRPGLFLSICVNSYDATGIKTFCISIAGNTAGGGSTVGYTRFSGHNGNAPIRMQNTTNAAGIDYRANLITFDVDGFTLTISHAASGNRPIHWWAMSGGGIAGIHTQDGNASFDVNFPIRSMLGLNGPASFGGAEVTTDNDTWLHFGSNHYPSDAATADTRRSAVTHTGCVPSSSGGRQGFTEQSVYSGAAGNRLCFDLRSSGPGIFDAWVYATPTVLHSDIVAISTDTTVTSQEIVAVLGTDGNADGLATPATVGQKVTKTVPSWFDEFGLVMFSTINGAAAQTTSAVVRYGLGVLHPDYQGCVVMGADGSFYQSRTRMAATCTAAGVQTARGELLGATFTAETMLGGSVSGNYHALGGLLPSLAWIPQIYRRIVSPP